MSAQIVHRTDLAKVIRTDLGGLKSALLTVSANAVNYGLPNDQVFRPTPKNGTPILAYTGLTQAFDFVAKHGGSREVYGLEVYGTVVPVEQVLQVHNLGWDRNLNAFWEAVRYGKSLAAFHTVKAPAGTVAVFGVFRLLGQQFKPAPAQPVAAYNAPRW